MHCGQCGKPIDADSRFCTHCGAAVTPVPGDADSGRNKAAPDPSHAAPDTFQSAPDSLQPAPAAAGIGASAGEAAAAAGAALGKIDPAGILARVKNILLTPRTEWPAISAEGKPAADVWMGYVAPLAALAAIAGGLGMILFGVHVPLIGNVRVGPVPAIAHVITQFVMTFVGLFVLMLIINALAPTFGGQKDSLRALKVAAYSFTPVWVGALLTIIPALGVIAGLIGLYGFYLLYLGLPVMMRSAQEKAVGYTIVTVLCAIVISLVVTFLIGGILSMMGMGAIGAARSDRGADTAASVLSSMMGGKSDADKARMKEALTSLQKMGEQVAQAEKNARATGKDPTAAAANSVDLKTTLAAVGTMMAGGKEVHPVDFHGLKELLPETIAGFARRDASGQSGEAAGMKGSSATGRYADAGNARLTLEIADLGSLAGLAGLAAKFNPNMEKETDAGYERTRTVNGQLMHQQYNRQSKSGEFDVMIGNRFTVTAHGSNVSEDTLVAAVKSVDVGKLVALAKQAGPQPSR